MMAARLPLPRLTPWLIVVATPLALFVVMTTHGGLDFQARSAPGHFYIVSAVSLVTVGLGLVAAVAAVRARNARLVLLALAFLSMSGIFAVHGLATPGFLVGGAYDEVSGVNSRASTLVASLFLAMSAMSLPRALEEALRRWRVAVLGGWTLLLAGYAAVALAAPAALPWHLASQPWVFNGSFVVVVALGSFAAWRYFDGYRRSGLPMYGAVALGSALVVQAQLGMHFGETFRFSWWLYHVWLLLGFGAMVGGLLLEAVRGHHVEYVLEDLALRDPIEQIRAGYTDAIRSLAAALEARDGYTLGHGERVAGLALMIGERMRLSPDRLRALYHGALLHDVGKIGVPDRVLHKPGTLTASEYEVIKEHPTRGDAILSAAFKGAVERNVIRHHHERYDGAGYPDGLAADAIPLEARIAAVADVYDALRSTRSYREAWSAEQAQAHIRSLAGEHFDPDCVEAFFAVVQRWEERFADDATPYLELRPAAA